MFALFILFSSVALEILVLVLEKDITVRVESVCLSVVRKRYHIRALYRGYTVKYRRVDIVLLIISVL